MELFLVFTLLQVLDVYTTHIILEQGGKELNPVMAKLFDAIGHMEALIVIKTIVVLATYQFLLTEPWVLGGLCAFYLWVVTHNARQIK